MTLQESIQMQERSAKKVQPIISAMDSLPTNLGERFYESYNRMLQSIPSTYTLFSGISASIDALSQAQQNLVHMGSVIDYTGIETAMTALERIGSEAIDTASLFANSSYQELLGSLADTLTQVEPYLPQEEKERCESVIRPKLSEKSRTRLTLSDALSILSILLSILFFVLGSMPDDQAERIIQQQDEIIANQEAEIAQLREEDQALLDALDSLSGSINLLTDEIELLRDELGDPDDLPNSPSQANPGDPQQDDSDAQD